MLPFSAKVALTVRAVCCHDIATTTRTGQNNEFGDGAPFACLPSAAQFREYAMFNIHGVLRLAAFAAVAISALLTSVACNSTTGVPS